MPHTGAELVAFVQFASAPPIPCTKLLPLPGSVRASDTTSNRKSFTGVAVGR